MNHNYCQRWYYIYEQDSVRNNFYIEITIVAGD